MSHDVTDSDSETIEGILPQTYPLSITTNKLSPSSDMNLVIDVDGNTMVCKHREWFEDDFQPEKFHIATADGDRGLDGFGSGTWRIPVIGPDGTESILILMGTIWAPSSKCNILPVEALFSRSDMTADWGTECINIRHPSSMEPIAVAKLTEKGLYELPLDPREGDCTHRMPPKDTTASAEDAAGSISGNQSPSREPLEEEHPLDEDSRSQTLDEA
ncbi:hypothetical protein NX059_012446 [Plenodomus lindquistii]|nr:hypothetical protein NX059_012446 [Plenodomus lindquistii]